MNEQTIKVAVSGFHAAKVGHDKRRKSAAAKKLAQAAAEFLGAGKSPADLARMLSAEK